MEADEPIRLLRMWRFLFLLHLLAAGAAWWLLPGGFAVDHPRFWINGLLPWLIMPVFAFAFWAAVTQRGDLASAMIPVVPAFWLGAVVSIKVTFWHSGWKWWLLAFAAATLATAAFVSLRGRAFSRTVATLAVLAALCGAWLPTTQRSDPPSTRLWGDALPPLLAADKSPLAQDHPLLTELTLLPQQEVVQIKRAPLTLWLAPLLSFDNRSLDRGWAPGGRTRNLRRLQQVWQLGPRIVAQYAGDEAALLEIGRDGETLELNGYVSLPREVYTHLNDYCVLGIRGHRQLSLSFSPCPEYRVEPLPFDYPVGRPLRFACLGEDGQFRVMQASSAEKGPFHTLAAGPLNRGDPLAVTLYDADTAVVRIVFADWAAQCSTELSPTAGWGMPQNEVGFYRQRREADSDVVLMLSLARTSVGRGFDSVGHAAGVYRNRIQVESPQP